MWKHTLPMFPRCHAFEADFFEKVFFRALGSIPSPSIEAESEHFKKASWV